MSEYLGGLFHSASARTVAGKNQWLRKRKGVAPRPPRVIEPKVRKAHNKGQTPRLDEFAEHLAEGATVKEAAAAMGLSPKTGENMFGMLRKRLGWQAV